MCNLILREASSDCTGRKAHVTVKTPFSLTKPALAFECCGRHGTQKHCCVIKKHTFNLAPTMKIPTGPNADESQMLKVSIPLLKTVGSFYLHGGLEQTTRKALKTAGLKTSKVYNYAGNYVLNQML